MSMDAFKTKKLYYEDVKLRDCETTLKEIISYDENNVGFIFAETIFFPEGGGQPGDSGSFFLAEASGAPDRITLSNTLIERAVDGSERILHLAAKDKCAGLLDLFQSGSKLKLELDFARRFRIMRMHSALHLLCAALPYAVTGGSIGLEKSHLDFDPDGGIIDKNALNERLTTLVSENHSVVTFFLKYEQFVAQWERNSALVRTAAVTPPVDSNKLIRMVRIGDDDHPIDLQACGGTHVQETGLIGNVQVQKVENKGKRNRRVRLVLLEDST